MARLPIVDDDDGTWGTILNEFLEVEHNADGTQKTLGVTKGGTNATNAATARTNLGAISSSDAQALVDTHVNDTTDAHDASAISILDTAADFTATDVEGALAELQTADEADEAALAAHISDASAAHAASAISVSSTTLVGTGTDAQAVFEELDNAIVDLPELVDGDGTTVDSGTAGFLSIDLAPSDRVDRQVFSANGTWTKPTNVSASSMTLIRLMGAGASGGGGRVAATGAIRGGGGGGGAACISERWIATSLLGADEAVVVPAGPTGGAGGVGPTNNGAVGVSGADATFGDTILVRAGGGYTAIIGGSAAGVAGAGGSYGFGAVIGTHFNNLIPAVGNLGGAMMAGNFGGNGGVGAGTGYTIPSGGSDLFTRKPSNLNPGGGGGGGGITSGTTTEAGWAGGAGDLGCAAGGAAGADAGGAGANGAAPTSAGIAGGGGGGGGSKNGAHGGKGGNGGRGAGGGGGGASSGASSGNGGAGGDGGAGYAEIVTWL